MANLFSVNYIDIEDYSGNLIGQVELPFPIEISIQQINLPLFTFSSVDTEGDDNILRIQFDGEEGGFYEIDEVDENATALMEIIKDAAESNLESKQEDAIYSAINDAMYLIMRGK